MNYLTELIKDEISQAKDDIRKASRNGDEDERVYHTGYLDGLEISLKWIIKYGEQDEPG